MLNKIILLVLLSPLSLFAQGDATPAFATVPPQPQYSYSNPGSGSGGGLSVTNPVAYGSFTLHDSDSTSAFIQLDNAPAILGQGNVLLIAGPLQATSFIGDGASITNVVARGPFTNVTVWGTNYTRASVLINTTNLDSSGGVIPLRFANSNLDGTTIDFNFIAVPEGGYDDNVFRFGINMGPGGVGPRAGKNGIGIGMESLYQGNMEFHCPSMYQVNGHEERGMSWLMPTNTPNGVQVLFGADTYNFFRGIEQTNGQYMTFAPTTGIVMSDTNRVAITSIGIGLTNPDGTNDVSITLNGAGNTGVSIGYFSTNSNGNIPAGAVRGTAFICAPTNLTLQSFSADNTDNQAILTKTNLYMASTGIRLHGGSLNIDAGGIVTTAGISNTAASDCSFARTVRVNANGLGNGHLTIGSQNASTTPSYQFMYDYYNAVNGAPSYVWYGASTYWGVGQSSKDNGDFRIGSLTGTGFTGTLDASAVSPWPTSTGSDTLQLSTKVSVWGTLTATNGVASYCTNLAAPFSFTFPNTTVNWTNPRPVNIQVYIDNAAVTGTAIKKNGTTIFTSITGDATIGLQPGEYFSETYTVGTPTATYSPF